MDASATKRCRSILGASISRHNHGARTTSKGSNIASEKRTPKCTVLIFCSPLSYLKPNVKPSPASYPAEVLWPVPGEHRTGPPLRGTRIANIPGLGDVLATNTQFLWMVCGLLSSGSGSSKRSRASLKSHRATGRMALLVIVMLQGSPFTLSLVDLIYLVWGPPSARPQTSLFETREHTSLTLSLPLCWPLT